MNLNNDFRKNLTKGKQFDKVSVKGGVRAMRARVEPHSGFGGGGPGPCKFIYLFFILFYFIFFVRVGTKKKLGPPMPNSQLFSQTQFKYSPKPSFSFRPYHLMYSK